MDQIKKKLEEALSGRFKLAAALQKREQERKAKDEARAAREKQQQPVKTNEAEVCPVCDHDPCICESGQHIQENDLHAQLKAFAAARGGKLTTSAERKQATADIIAKREKEAANRPKPTPQPHIEKYPLGGRDEKSGRSYSEEYMVEYGDTAKGQKMLAKIHHRAANRVTSKQADKDPAYARKVQQTQNRAWERLAVKEQNVAEGTKPGWMLKQDPVLAKKIKDAQKLAKKRQASYGNPAAGKSVKEEHDLDEAIKLNTKVSIHAPGKSYHGQVGRVGEIRHGLFKGAPKTYTVDYGNGQSIQLDKKNVKLHKESTDICTVCGQTPCNCTHMNTFSKFRAGLVEKTLTPAEKKKREEVAQAIEREHPGMPMGMKMAIATKTAKRVAEDTEQIDELSKGTLASYAKKAALDSVMRMGQAVEKGNAKGAEKAGRRYGGVVKAVDRLAKEETELEDQHLCAKHVRSALLGDGVVLEAQHADPDENGQIEWYMVEFRDGIHKVFTEDLEIMLAEYHGNHKKKRMTNG